jgi:hypothetical protein
VLARPGTSAARSSRLPKCLSRRSPGAVRSVVLPCSCAAASGPLVGTSPACLEQFPRVVQPECSRAGDSADGLHPGLVVGRDPAGDAAGVRTARLAGVSSAGRALDQVRYPDMQPGGMFSLVVVRPEPDVGQGVAVRRLRGDGGGRLIVVGRALRSGCRDIKPVVMRLRDPARDAPGKGPARRAGCRPAVRAPDQVRHQADPPRPVLALFVLGPQDDDPLRGPVRGEHQLGHLAAGALLPAEARGRTAVPISHACQSALSAAARPGKPLREPGWHAACPAASSGLAVERRQRENVTIGARRCCSHLRTVSRCWLVTASPALAVPALRAAAGAQCPTRWFSRVGVGVASTWSGARRAGRT